MNQASRNFLKSFSVVKMNLYRFVSARPGVIETEDTQIAEEPKG